LSKIVNPGGAISGNFLLYLTAADAVRGTEFPARRIPRIAGVKGSEVNHLSSENFVCFREVNAKFVNNRKITNQYS